MTGAMTLTGTSRHSVDPPLSVVILLPWRPSTGRKRQLPVIVPSPVMFFVTLAGSPE